MENWLPYNSQEIRFIRIFNKILISFLVLSVVVLIVLPVHDSISAHEGEIISQSPQIDYVSPFESILDSMYVKESDVVKKGDTLLVLYNNALRKDLNKQETEYKNLIQGKEGSQISINNITRKIEVLENEQSILIEEYDIDVLKNSRELKWLAKDVFFLKEKLEVATLKLQMDSSLFKNEVISKLDITNSYDNYLTYLKNFNEDEKRLSQTEIDSKTIKNIFKKNKNDLHQQRIILEEELRKEKERLLITKNKINDLEFSLKYYDTEIDKQYIISDLDGIVGQVYNDKTSSSFLKKNEVLVSVSPLTNTFYAKLIIPQRDVWQIKVGQEVNLKIDAYYYYEHGIIKGTVRHISERVDEKSGFYILIELKKKIDIFELRSGYSIKGEIIVEKMRLWKFILKKIFRKTGDLTF